MTKMNKAQLIDENAVLRTKLEELRMELASLKDAVAKQPVPQPSARALAMQAARAEAMNTGRCTRVQF